MQNFSESIGASWQRHRQRPVLLALVIGGSLLTFAIALMIGGYFGMGWALLGIQWGPIGLDLRGNLAGIGYFNPVAIGVLVIRAVLTGFAICLVLDVPFSVRGAARAGLVYVVVTIVGAAAEMFVNYVEQSFFTPGESGFAAILVVNTQATIALLAAGFATPFLVGAFTPVSARVALKKGSYWALVATTVALWNTTQFFPYLWPVWATIAAASCLLAAQSIVLGATYISAADQSEEERLPARAAIAAF